MMLINLNFEMNKQYNNNNNNNNNNNDYKQRKNEVEEKYIYMRSLEMIFKNISFGSICLFREQYKNKIKFKKK